MGKSSNSNKGSQGLDFKYLNRTLNSSGTLPIPAVRRLLSNLGRGYDPEICNLLVRVGLDMNVFGACVEAFRDEDLRPYVITLMMYHREELGLHDFKKAYLKSQGEYLGSLRKLDTSGSRMKHGLEDIFREQSGHLFGRVAF